jgi:eukaryotic-like serine/threonine-protein kinase
MTGRFGHYLILEKIGSGAMGEVFRARDERLGRDVALKLIRPSSSENPDHLRRFELEARAAAALNHPNILAIYDVGFEGETPYIVSELLHGKTLRVRLSEGVIPIREATDYALQIAHGLISAHERRIVHRDLKPENLFLTHDGRVKILDFGVAKLQIPVEENPSIESMTTITKSGAVVGTYAYMSPEQLRGKSVDHRSDIFSFGAILYEILTGYRAFRGETEVDTMTAVLKEQPPHDKLDAAMVPTAYQNIVRHCLEKEADNRFQTSKDLAFALETLAKPSPADRTQQRETRTANLRLPFWTLATVLTAAIIALLTVWMRPPTSNPAYRRLTFEAGTVYSARFASDGQSIVYSAAWNNNPPQLFSTVGNSLLSQPLNLTASNLLAVSPTNELALVSHGTQNGQLETVDGMLVQAPLAGGSPKELLADVRWADWSADGKLAVVRNVDGHCRLEYPIGNVLYQSGGWISHPRFSPKYDKIAFLDHPTLWDFRGSVAIVDLSGHMQTLGGLWASTQGIGWRPDGKEIWFAAAAKGTILNLMAVDLAGQTRLLLNLPVAIGLQDITSDGRVLVTLNSRRLAMASSSLGGKEDVELSWHDWNSARDISLDDQYVLFEDSSEAAGAGYAVAVRKIDGTLPIKLGEGSSGGFSPDGKWALSVSTSVTPQVTLLPIGPGQPRSIDVKGVEHIHNGWARFLPNGQQLALNGDKTGTGSRCYVVDASSGEARPVTPEGVLCGPFSPDNQSLVGVGANQSLALYSLTGGEPRQIPHLNAHFHPLQWSNDGSLLYGHHVGESPCRIYKVEIATGKETAVQVLKPGVSAGVVIVSPIVVSRDGTHFAYSYYQFLSTLYLISGLR